MPDDDTIDDTNLQRQTAFCEADIGQSKAEVLQGRLNALNSRTQISALNERLSEARLLELVQSVDLVLDCCDNFATRQAVNRACVAARTPLVSGAAVRFEGQIAVYRPDLPTPPATPACLTANPPTTALVPCSACFHPWWALSAPHRRPKRSSS